MKKFDEEGYGVLFVQGDVWSAAALLERSGFRVVSFKSRRRRKEARPVPLVEQQALNKPEGDSDAE